MTASALGYTARGFDLNPVMVITAKARSLNIQEKPSLLPLAVDIAKKAARTAVLKDADNDCDPLCEWFIPSSVKYLRGLERATQLLLIDNTKYLYFRHRDDVGAISALAAFFYTALFRTTRSLVKKFVASNPTWVKRPKDKKFRLRPCSETIFSTFKTEIRSMISTLEDDLFDFSSVSESANIVVASSDSLPLDNNSVDLVLTSPPYCTRIDYAVATMPELALLGYEFEVSFEDLRRKLIGSVTVPKSVSPPLPDWGPTCNQLLEQIRSHESKASESYYYKNHVQYFNGVFKSIQEICKKLANKGVCVLVAQDSYYKEIYNNLPQILIEMSEFNGLTLKRRVNFGQPKTMAGVNVAAKKYRHNFEATESVLCFVKDQEE
jgi:hypothetical protein